MEWFKFFLLSIPASVIVGLALGLIMAFRNNDLHEKDY
jgi:predicted membrane chloride channel (bestrophin family)